EGLKEALQGTLGEVLEALQGGGGAGLRLDQVHLKGLRGPDGTAVESLDLHGLEASLRFRTKADVLRDQIAALQARVSPRGHGAPEPEALIARREELRLAEASLKELRALGEILDAHGRDPQKNRALTPAEQKQYAQLRQELMVGEVSAGLQQLDIT